MDFRYSITHNGIVRYLHKNRGGTSCQILGVENDKQKNLENLNRGYKRNEELSDNSRKKIVNRVLWLNQIANLKTYKTKKGQYIQYKISMLTLTLPSTQRHNTTFITEKCLTKFLNLMRNYYQMRNYIWKLELQQNGNVHYHIITDAEIDYNKTKIIWNKIINKYSYIDEYSNKFKGLNEHKYVELRMRELTKYSKNKLLNESKLRQELKETYKYQTSIGWNSPNSINLKRISVNNNIENYIAKYVSKQSNNEQNSQQILGVEKNTNEAKKVGRIYSNSENLSKVKNIKNNIQEILKFSYHYFSEVWHFKRIDYDYFNFVPIKLNNAIHLLKELKNEIEKELEKIGLIPYEEPILNPIFGLTDVLDYLADS